MVPYLVTSSGFTMLGTTPSLLRRSTSLTCAIAGQITSHYHIVRPLCWIGFALTSLGYGLFYGLLTSTSSFAIQEGVQVLIGFGTGISLSTPMLIVQAAMPFKDMAAATSAWILCRSLAATIGTCGSCKCLGGFRVSEANFKCLMMMVQDWLY